MKPPSADEPDGLDEEYRRASARDPSRPGEAVRQAVLDHAAKLAAERTAKLGGVGAKPGRPVASRTRWRPAIFGSLAAAAVAGILVAPHFLGPRPPAIAGTAAQPSRRSEGAAHPPESPALDRAPAARQAGTCPETPSPRPASLRKPDTWDSRIRGSLYSEGV